MNDDRRFQPLVYLLVLIFIALVAGLLWMDKGVGGPGFINTAQYTCSQEKIIQASFYEGEARLLFNDGRRVTLPQVAATSGVKYANQDESVVFWSKGNTAFVTEGAAGTETYSNCVTAGSAPGITEDWETYSKPLSGYSIQYPEAYAVNDSYLYTALGPGKEIRGVKFTIPQSLSLGTNLSSDTGISVEEITDPASCSPGRFMYDAQNIRTISEQGIDYSVADGGGAAAGNLYEEHVYAVPGTSPCLAVRYFIHSTNIGNYEPGAVREFDKAALLAEFDRIRHTLRVSR
jgi:membrane-bound inhibitor of C-type lysozyme